MSGENESTGDVEDNIDHCELQYQVIESPLPGTTVFIKNIHIKSEFNTLLYVHTQSLYRPQRLGCYKTLFIGSGSLIAVISTISLIWLFTSFNYIVFNIYCIFIANL
jgi:hypothetical protein